MIAVLIYILTNGAGGLFFLILVNTCYSCLFDNSNLNGYEVISYCISL